MKLFATDTEEFNFFPASEYVLFDLVKFKFMKLCDEWKLW